MPSRHTPLAAALLALFATPWAPLCGASDAPASERDAAPSDPLAAATIRALPEVDVTGIGAPYAPGISTIGAGTPAETRDIAQVVTVIPRAVLDAQGAASLSDASGLRRR